MTKANKILVWICAVTLIVTVTLSVLGSTMAYAIKDAEWKGTVETRLVFNKENDEDREERNVKAMEKLATQIKTLNKTMARMDIYVGKELERKYGIKYGSTSD